MTIDLGKYLHDHAPRGLFLLSIRSVVENPPQEGIDHYQPSGPQDSRLTLITDLGFVVKDAKDGSRDVFVQSIHTGQPIDGARIEAIGRNGQPVASATTANGGRAHLDHAPEGRREKAPLMIVAQKDGDFSFMPFNTRERTEDVSRFDTGGVENPASPKQIAAYLFSDRGIYRPGETAHISLIARAADWRTSLAGLPIEVEISDARGAVVARNPVKLSAAAFEEIAYTSQVASPTGTYQATAYLTRSAKSHEILGSASFKVQEFEPDRMKARVELSERPIEGWLKPSDLKARAVVAHLFGEAASGRRVEAEINLTSVLPHFSKYPDHRFQIGEGLQEPYHQSLAAAVTDEKGIAILQADLERFTGRAYRLNILARAFEAEGGRNVAAQNTAIISDAPYLAGVKPDGDLGFVQRGSTRSANWLAVNQNLAAVAVDGLALEWVQRKYVSTLTEQPNHTFKYVSRRKEIVRDSKPVKLAAGGSNLSLPTQEPGDFVLLLKDSAGTALNQLSYSVAGEANLSKSLDRDAELQIQLDKPAYAAGESIAVAIRAPYVGSGLITVERDHVYAHQWFRATTTSSVQHITVPADFEGNGYVNVQFVRDPSSDEIFLSPLSYGVAAFAASLKARTEPLTLTAPNEIKPGAILTMKVTSAEASRVAVLAVDEGILQVARYKNPDPLAHLFQKRMLEVQTSQILDLILPEFKKFLASAAPGGDADSSFAKHLNPFAKKRRAPVAYWSGIVDAGPGGRTFQYTVPDSFNGKLRIIAVAVSPNRIGTAVAGTEVKGAFILTPNVPTMAAPGDEFTVSVGVYNNTANPGPIHVELAPGAGVTAVGAPAVDLKLAEKREGVAEFRFKAIAVLGSTPLVFIARRGTVESRIEESVSIRPAVAYRTQLTLGRLERTSQTMPLKRDLFNEKRKVEAAIAATPLVWGQGLADWLDAYPYSCTEQVVSKGFAKLLGHGPAVAPTFGILQSRQNDAGAFGLWASSPVTAEFPSVYAANFLLEAKDRGVSYPPALLNSVNEWLAKYAATPASTLADGRAKAYAVYLLARQGLKPANALSNVEQELAQRYTKEWETDLAAAWLASTYRLMQRNADAERMIAKLPWSRQKKGYGGIYYEPTVHDAQLLYLLAHHFPARLTAMPTYVLEDLAEAASHGQVDSLSAAWTLLALDAYSKTAGATGVKFTLAEAGKDGREHPLKGDKSAISIGSTKVVFAKQGALPAFYALNESGFDRGAPGVAAPAIEIIHEFLNAKGDVVSRVKVGEEFLVRLRLRAISKPVSQIAVVDLLPGGTETILELQGTVGQLSIGLAEKSDWRPEHAEVREDRVVLYGDISTNVKTFLYRARATNAGTFQAPGAFAEAMYDPKSVGLSAPAKLEVVK